MANTVDLLLVEDNLADVELARESLAAGKLHVNLHVVTDGEAAMEFLHRRGVHTNAPVPDLIVLDLNLPKKNGSEVLADVKADPLLRRIPVVVLTSSEAEVDVLKSYDLGANCYITKPLDLTQFERIVQSIEDFWFSVVKLPREAAGMV